MACKCGGNCGCSAPKLTRRRWTLELEATDSDLLTVCRSAQVKDAVGSCVVLTLDDYKALVRAVK